MARQEIILGTPPQGLGGDPPRTASTKINTMTTELYTALGGSGTNLALPTALPQNKGGTGAVDGRPKFPSISISGTLSGISLAQGAYMGWNSGEAPGFNGEFNFLCNKGGGSGGFTWRTINSDNSATGPTMTYSYSGLLSVNSLALGVALPITSGGTGNNTGTAQKLVAGAIVGAVSQSGGLPTGAIIESGSNANGNYVKFADGTMICRRTLGVYSVAPGASLNDTSKSFAANFSTTPSLAFAWNCDYPYDISIGAEGGINSSSFRVSMKNRNASVTVSNIYLDVTAIGRWF